MNTENVDCDGNSGFVERLVRTSIECELETLTNPFVSVSLRLQRRETLGSSRWLTKPLSTIKTACFQSNPPPHPHRSVVNEEHNLKKAPNFPQLCCVESPQETFR